MRTYPSAPVLHNIFKYRLLLARLVAVLLHFYDLWVSLQNVTIVTFVWFLKYDFEFVVDRKLYESIGLRDLGGALDAVIELRYFAFVLCEEVNYFANLMDVVPVFPGVFHVLFVL